MRARVAVFDFASSQAEVFKHTAAPLVKDVFNGYNTTVFGTNTTTITINTAAESLTGVRGDDERR